MTAPLVVAVRASSLRDVLVWIHDGRGWLLDPMTEQWTPLTEAPGLGGRVIRDRGDIDAIVTKYGLPGARGAA
jgi:hypothetical protein